MSLIPFSLALGVLSNDPSEQATNYKTSTPVSIKQNVDGNPLASIYLDEDGTTPLSNPINTDTRGVAAFYIEAGEYIAEYQDDLQPVTSKFSVSTGVLQKLGGLTERSDLAQRSRFETTVAEIALGGFADGDKLVIADRAMAKFKVVAAGWPESVNNMDVLDAGGGKSALYEYSGELNIVHIGAVIGATMDSQSSSPMLQRAAQLGVPTYAPSGSYRITTGITMTSEGFTLRGDGNTTTFDCVMTDFFIKFPVSSGRSVKKFRDFNVYSTAGTMSAAGVAFLFDGSGSGGALSYTSGYHFSGIEIGGGGEFACGWDLTDTFRLTIRDCGLSQTATPIYIRGSVVQCTVDNVTDNNNDYIRGYKGKNYGAWLESRSDYSDSVTRVPENVKIMNCGFVFHRGGVRPLGLAIRLENNDLDFIRDVGIGYGGGDGHVYTGGYIAAGDAASPFLGVSISKGSVTDAVTVREITFMSYAASTAKHIAIQVGSGDAPPYLEVNGVVVDGNKIYGSSGTWNFGVQADRNRKLTLTNNTFATGVIKSGGFAINASNSKNLTCNDNTCNNQKIYVSAPVADSVGTVTGNSAEVITEFMAGTFEVARNRNVVE